MAKRAYLSNVTAIWPLPKQREMMAALPNWPDGYVIFEDEIDVRARRRKNPAVLAKRNEMLRVTTRPRGGEEVVVAALPVFAMSIEDMMHSLTLAGMRGAAVRFLNEGVTVEPGSGAEALHQIASAFSAAKFEGRTQVAGQISGAKKEAAAREKAEKVRLVYGDPSWPMSRLAEASGLSRNTLEKHLGKHREARVKWSANAKRATARAKKKEKGSE